MNEIRIGDILIINGKQYVCDIYRGKTTPKQEGHEIHTPIKKIENLKTWLYFEKFNDDA